MSDQNELPSGFTKKDLLDYEVQSWKTAIEVQQHFNNLEMQVRNFAITVLAGVIGAAAVVYKDSIQSSKLILLLGLIVWVAFFMMDRYWYHQLLIGAVKQAQEIENRISNIIPGITLTKTISENSPIIIGRWKIHSSSKVMGFYGIITFIILIILIFL